MKVKYLGMTQDQINFGSNDDPRPVLKEGEKYDLLGLEVHSYHTKVILTEFHKLRFNSVGFAIPDSVMQKAVNGWQENQRRIEKNYPYIYCPEE